MRLQPVILAGGVGSRLWPLSRRDMPKQFLALVGERSLLQETALRVAGMDAAAPPIVVCNESHAYLTLEQLRAVGVEPSAIVLEPQGRNTAPALTLAAHAALRGAADDPPLLLAMPADHAIGDVGAFRDAVAAGAREAADGAVVVFGVTPTAPETGFGYIKEGAAMRPGGASAPALRVERFVEKPDSAVAQGFLDAGGYLWNSGMFLMAAQVWLAELARRRGDIAAACATAMACAQWDAPFVWPDADAFTACPSESVDYAVMESAGAADGAAEGAPFAVVPLDAGWSDVGAWPAVWAMGERDGDGNRTQGDVVVQDTRNSLLVSRGRLVAGVGVDDLVVVETADAVLVARRDGAQGVRAVVEALARASRAEESASPQVHRPWGAFSVLDKGTGYQVKRLTINPGAAISLQRHRHRSERWVVVQGEAAVVRGEERVLLAVGETIEIPAGTVHRLANPGAEPLEIIEVQRGDYLGEDDIERLEDLYGRHRERGGGAPA